MASFISYMERANNLQRVEMSVVIYPKGNHVLSTHM